MICKACSEEITGPVVKVGRRQNSEVEVHFLHFSCFEKVYEDFKNWVQELPEGMSIPQITEEAEIFSDSGDARLASNDTVKEKEDRSEEYKQRAMDYVARANSEKEGDAWLGLVNDPGCYHAIRNILSLKGIQMTVEQFEEIAAVFMVIIKDAHLKSMRKKSSSENVR